MRLLAIDPALRNVGLAWGTVDDLRFIDFEGMQLLQTQATKVRSIRKNSDDLRCARELFTGIHEVIRQQDIDVVAVEVPSGTKSARASWTLGIMVGLLASIEQPLIEVSAVDVKDHFTGNRNASKETMIRTAVNFYPDLPWLRRGGKLLNSNEHLADAVAIGSYARVTRQFRDLVQAATWFAA